MNRRKLHISQWCVLGLAAVLAVGCLIAGAGSALARYRVEAQESVVFVAREGQKIYLGQTFWSEDGQIRLFDDKAEGTWKQVEDQTQLEFAVANGTMTEDPAQEDQQVRIRLVGSPGVWDGARAAQIQLLVPKKTDANQYDTYTATATKIQPQSPMHAQFGDGWMFSFHDKIGQELTWTLTGGQFSCYEMRLVLADEMLIDTSFLQLQVIG